MQRRTSIIIVTVALVLIVLVALNAASYLHESESAVDTESRPNRSTHNAGLTGTRALYDLLYESGAAVVRWREPPAALLNTSIGAASAPHTFVVIGQTRSPLSDGETEELLSWVRSGGRLVVIDRVPDARLLPVMTASGGRWGIITRESEVRPGTIDAENRAALTEGVSAITPGQLTSLTSNVERVQPSLLASRLRFVTGAEDGNVVRGSSEGETSVRDNNAPPETSDESEEPPSAADALPRPSPRGDRDWSDERELRADVFQAYAPNAQFTNDAGDALLIEYRYGEGRIVLLSDPFIVSNGGIRAEDNLQLALNIVRGGSGSDAPRRGVIAFDEYHQGYGATRNEVLAYFAGTPVLAFALQASLIALAILWTRGRRWARPLPVPRADRGSKLEFIQSMAELQERARAFDLAIENIYGRARRALARFGGARPDMPRGEIAAHVAARSGANREGIENLMRECEEVVNGAPTTARKSLALVARLRETERALGVQMRSREIKQAGKR